jgi:hypothetical protein
MVMDLRNGFLASNLFAAFILLWMLKKARMSKTQSAIVYERVQRIR